MANRGIVDINTAYNNVHGETAGPPGPWFATGDDLFDCSEGCSPLEVSTVYAIGEISVLSMALTSLQVDAPCFSVAVQLLLTRAKPL